MSTKPFGYQYSIGFRELLRKLKIRMGDNCMKNNKFQTNMTVEEWKEALGIITGTSKSELDELFHNMISVGMFEIEPDGNMSMAALNHDTLTVMNKKAKRLMEGNRKI